MFRLPMRFLILASMLLLADAARNDTHACGGFFCSSLPIVAGSVLHAAVLYDMSGEEGTEMDVIQCT